MFRYFDIEKDAAEYEVIDFDYRLVEFKKLIKNKRLNSIKSEVIAMTIRLIEESLVAFTNEEFITEEILREFLVNVIPLKEDFFPRVENLPKTYSISPQEKLVIFRKVLDELENIFYSSSKEDIHDYKVAMVEWWRFLYLTIQDRANCSFGLFQFRMSVRTFH